MEKSQGKSRKNALLTRVLKSPKKISESTDAPKLAGVEGDFTSTHSKLASSPISGAKEASAISSAVEDSAPRFVKNLTELAAVLGVSRKSLTRWRESADFPLPRSDGRFEIAQVREWIAANAKCSGSGRDVPLADVPADLAGLSYMELKQREIIVKIKIQELELAQKRKELVSLEEAKEICVEILKPISQRLKNMAALLGIRANPSDPTGAKTVLKEWADETFTEIERVCKQLNEKN